MYSMFCYASSFNADLSEWDVAKVNDVSDMDEVFNGASSFEYDNRPTLPDDDDW